MDDAEPRHSGPKLTCQSCQSHLRSHRKPGSRFHGMAPADAKLRLPLRAFLAIHQPAASRPRQHAPTAAPVPLARLEWTGDDPNHLPKTAKADGRTDQSVVLITGSPSPRSRIWTAAPALD